MILGPQRLGYEMYKSQRETLNKHDFYSYVLSDIEIYFRKWEVVEQYIY